MRFWKLRYDFCLQHRLSVARDPITPRSGGIAPRLNFGTRWRLCSQFQAPAALRSGKAPPPVHTKYMAGWATEPEQKLEGEENMLRVRGIETTSTRCPVRNYTDYAIKQQSRTDDSKLLLVHSFGNTSLCSFTFGLRLT